MILNNDVLQAKGLKLNPPPAPVGSYVQCLQSGNQLHLSGGISVNGDDAYYGKVGAEVDLATAQKAAAAAILNRLAVIQHELGGFERLTKIVAVNGFVNSSPDFTDQAKVLNGASDLLVELFGPEAAHTRSAVGVAALPLNVAVEISMVVEIEPDYAG
ncbi:MAG: RidA family protein [Akkermansiaceae bacterium]|nr:RidA family protein [Akkermansiaceae bacterium]